MNNLAEKISEDHIDTADLKLVLNEASVGEQLKRAREARDWTLPQVARRLNLSEHYINAIETNDFSSLPGTTFIRGYLRNYAQCVELENSDILAAYERHISADEKPAKLRKREKLKAFSTAPVMRALGALSVLLFVFLSMYWWRSEQQLVTPAVEQLAVVEVETVEGETKVEILDLGVLDVIIEYRGTDDLRVATGPGDALLVEFTDSSWLEVRDTSGKVLFSGVKQTGEVLQLASLMPLDIAIGNAAAVKLSYNSAPVDLTTYTRNGNAAKLTLGL